MQPFNVFMRSLWSMVSCSSDNAPLPSHRSVFVAATTSSLIVIGTVCVVVQTDEISSCQFNVCDLVKIKTFINLRTLHSSLIDLT